MTNTELPPLVATDLARPHDLDAELDALALRMSGRWPARLWRVLGSAEGMFADPLHAAVARALREVTDEVGGVDPRAVYAVALARLDGTALAERRLSELLDACAARDVPAAEVEVVLTRLARCALTRRYRRLLQQEVARCADTPLSVRMLREGLTRLLAGLDDLPGSADTGVEPGVDAALRVFRRAMASSGAPHPIGVFTVDHAGDGLRRGDLVAVRAEDHLVRPFLTALVLRLGPELPVLVSSSEEGPASLVAAMIGELAGIGALTQGGLRHDDPEFMELSLGGERVSASRLWITSDARAGWRYAWWSMAAFANLADDLAPQPAPAPVGLVIFDRLPPSSLPRRELGPELASTLGSGKLAALVIDRPEAPIDPEGATVELRIEAGGPGRLRVCWHRRGERPVTGLLSMPESGG